MVLGYSRLILLVFIIGITDICYSVPLSDFLPYGIDAGDTGFPPNDDGSTSFNLTHGFVFYNTKYKTVYVNNNGVLSFTVPISAYTPEEFPVEDPLIAPFWADVDTTGTGNVWYRTTTEPGVVLRVANEVKNHFGITFLAIETVVVTWDHVGYYSAKSDKVNTFQCILATDSSLSYVIFLYADDGINWYSGEVSDGIPAQIGFNQGRIDGYGSGSGSDVYGVHNVVNTSFTNDVVNVEEYSNVDDGDAGFYIWQVNSEVVGGSECTNKNPTLIIAPSYGHQLGGTPIVIKGPCYNIADEILCQFVDVDEKKDVNGIVVDTKEALCISPMLNGSGNIELKVFVNSDSVGTTKFYSQPYYEVADVTTATNDLLIKNGDTVTLNWISNSFFPQASNNAITVDVVMYKLLVHPHPYNIILSKNNSLLSTNVENTGSTSVNITDIAPESLNGNYFTSPYSVLMMKVVVNSSTSFNNYWKALLTLQSSVNNEVAGRWTHVLFIKDKTVDDDYCKTWSMSDSFFFKFLEPGNSSCEDCISACPCNVLQAELPNSGFEQTTGTGLRIIDKFIHTGASVCYTSSEVKSTGGDGFLTFANGQTCCYNSEGNLIDGMTETSKGFQTAISPLSKKPWANHVLYDITPYLECCIPPSQDCIDHFYTRRPSDNCQNFDVIGAGWMFGDPHLLTLDGHQYTFNGRGEFILIETLNNRFTLQGRMIPAENEDSTESLGTVFSAIVGKQNDSDVVEFRASVIGVLLYINGEYTELTTGLPERFNGVTLSNRGNGTIGAVFSTGTYIEITQQYGYLAGVSVSLPHVFMDSTEGLLGNYNGDLEDDLTPRNSLFPLPLNSSLETVHKTFGVSWIVDDPSNSLFSYGPSEDFYSYYDPTFSPVFSPVFSNSSLEEEANVLCQGDISCLFDIAVTGRVEIGISTLQQVEIIINVTETSKPITCDPQCVEGACVATNKCNCPYGFEGNLCELPIISDCGEDNPCQNNESCTLHVFTYYCYCVPPFTGQYCENVDCGELTTDNSIIEVSYNSTLNGAMAVYSCTVGYILSDDDAYSICQNNGSWSMEQPDCIQIDCKEPSSDNAYIIVIVDSTVFGSVALYSCDKGYELMGDANRTCGENELWSGEQPICIINCGPPPTWGSGVLVEYNSTTLGSVARYHCNNKDHELSGPEIVSCLANGTWSEENIECTEPDFDSILYIIIGTSVTGAIILFVLLIIIFVSIGMISTRFKATIVVGKHKAVELSEI